MTIRRAKAGDSTRCNAESVTWGKAIAKSESESGIAKSWFLSGSKEALLVRHVGDYVQVKNIGPLEDDCMEISLVDLANKCNFIHNENESGDLCGNCQFRLMDLKLLEGPTYSKLWILVTFEYNEKYYVFEGFPFYNNENCIKNISCTTAEPISGMLLGSSTPIASVLLVGGRIQLHFSADSVAPFIFTPPYKPTSLSAQEFTRYGEQCIYIACSSLEGKIYIYQVNKSSSIPTITLLDEIAHKSSTSCNLHLNILASKRFGFLTLATCSDINVWIIFLKPSKRPRFFWSVSNNATLVRTTCNHNSCVVQYLERDKSQKDDLVTIHSRVFDITENITSCFCTLTENEHINDIVPSASGLGCVLVLENAVKRVTWIHKPAHCSTRRSKTLGRLRISVPTNKEYRPRKRIVSCCHYLRRTSPSLLMFDKMCCEFNLPEIVQLYPPGKNEMDILIQKILDSKNTSLQEKEFFLVYLNQCIEYGESKNLNPLWNNIICENGVMAYTYWLMDLCEYQELTKFLSSVPYNIDNILRTAIRELLNRGVSKHILPLIHIHCNPQALISSISECFFVHTNNSVALSFWCMKNFDQFNIGEPYLFRRLVEICLSPEVSRENIRQLTQLPLTLNEEKLLENSCVNSNISTAALLPILYYLQKGKYTNIIKYAKAFSPQEEPKGEHTSQASYFLDRIQNLLHTNKPHSEVSEDDFQNLLTNLAIIVNEAISLWPDSQDTQDTDEQTYSEQQFSSSKEDEPIAPNNSQELLLGMEDLCDNLATVRREPVFESEVINEENDDLLELQEKDEILPANEENSRPSKTLMEEIEQPAAEEIPVDSAANLIKLKGNDENEQTEEDLSKSPSPPNEIVETPQAAEDPELQRRESELSSQPIISEEDKATPESGKREKNYHEIRPIVARMLTGSSQGINGFKRLGNKLLNLVPTRFIYPFMDATPRKGDPPEVQEGVLDANSGTPLENSSKIGITNGAPGPKKRCRPPGSSNNTKRKRKRLTKVSKG